MKNIKSQKWENACSIEGQNRGRAKQVKGEGGVQKEESDQRQLRAWSGVEKTKRIYGFVFA